MQILIAEDDPVSCRMLEHTLVQWGYDVVVARDGTQAWQILQQEDAPQLLILDWMMPGMDGLEICRQLRKRKEKSYVYTLLLTAKKRKEDMVAGLEAGADDYLTKPFDANELKVRLRAGRRILDLQTALVATQEALREQATRDSLTRLWNHEVILDILERELAHARREGKPVSIAMADLDHFKRVNDTYGHMAGDAVLCEAARRMLSSVRTGDVIGRYGGEEFLIVLPGCQADNATNQAERLRTCIGEKPMDTSEGMISVTLSLGVATSDPTKEVSSASLIQAADEALYWAKGDGRNQVKLATVPEPGESPQPENTIPTSSTPYRTKGKERDSLYTPNRDRQAQVTSRLAWEGRIRQALAKDLFLLYYQPILDLRHNRISQYEVLLRMAGDKDDIISPADFLGVAESSELIYAIDRWVLRQAIHVIARHAQTGRRLCLEVNLSGRTFADSKLLPMIQRELAETTIDPTCLVLEITESAVIVDINQARKFVDTLKGLGCRFAIDDFGVGFSSFYNLKHLPVDYVKIDGSFIQDLPRNLADQHLVKAMVAVARGLGKQTIAEFVEDEETLQLLREYGVDFAQGYHIGRPQAVP